MELIKSLKSSGIMDKLQLAEWKLQGRCLECGGEVFNVTHSPEEVDMYALRYLKYKGRASLPALYGLSNHYCFDHGLKRYYEDR